METLTTARVGTTMISRYKPALLRPVAEPIGQWLLGREIRARIAACGRACSDPAVLDAV